jgi:hypothetical protein
MLRRFFPTPTDDAPDESAADSSVVGSGPSGEPDLAALPIVGITRRRAAILLGALLAGWIIILFARQVSEASAATGRAETMVAENAARKNEIARLERELQRIQEPRYVVQQARGYGLGSPKEIAFTLGANAPTLPPDAPGSAALRVGARNSGTPLESWLTLLFGPRD